MKLVVGENDYNVKIDTVPQVMANASPVFRAMLQPERFVEGQKLMEQKPFTILLPDDEPLAMTILCDILHLRADKIPLKTMTSDLLAAFATLVDKYDCAIAIHPWPMLWLAGLKLSHNSLKEVEKMTIEELPQWIYISCHLGYSDMFRQCTSALIRKAPKFDSHGVLFLSSCGGLSHESPLQTYLTMLKFAEQLDGVLYVKHKVQCTIRGGMEPVHSQCTLASEVQREVKSIFEGSQVGLELFEFGNQAYRKISKPHDSQTAGFVTETGILSTFSDSTPGHNFGSIILADETILM